MKQGFLIIDKAKGWTSHDVVAKSRGILQERKIGHLGTLDPLATGVLVLAVGRDATKQVQELMGADKEYFVEMEMGLKFTEAQLISSLKKASGELVSYYGSMDVELGKIQKIERADKSFPVSGLPDALNSAYLKRTGKGKFKVANGDTFIMFCSFSAQGNDASSVLPFGVSARKESKHFTDQMKLYAEHRTKKVYFSEAEVKQNQQSLKLLKVK